MDYSHYDSTGADGAIPLVHQNRVSRRTRVAGNQMLPVLGSASYPITHVETDFETQIHQLEQDAYSSVLRAFKAQSDAITWDKESLITELRKELHLSNEEHRQLLNKVNTDDIIKRIREWRQGVGHQAGMLSTTHAFHEPSPSPTVSASRKIAQSVPSQSFAAPSLSFQPQTVSASHYTSSIANRGALPGAKGKKHKRYLSLPPGESNRAASEFAEGAAEGAALVGRRVRTRWPDDNNFYEAVIRKYDPVDGRYALVYDMNTPNEAWEWINLSEISPNDLQWVGEDPVSRQRGNGGAGSEINRTVSHGHVPGTGRGATNDQNKKDSLPPQNGNGKNSSDEIAIFCTNTLVKEVKRIFSSDHPDPTEMETARKYLKDHENALIDAIAKLGYITEGESDEGGNDFSLARCMERG